MNQGKLTVLGVLLLFLFSSTIIGIFLLSISGGQEPLSGTTTCPERIEAAVTAVAEQCQRTGTNQICYPRQVDKPDLQQTGIIQDVAAFEEIRLDPVDPQAESWHIAFIQLQSNLPDPETITAVAFGEIDITNGFPAMVEHNETSNREAPYDQPMQAFYLRTGNSPTCEDVSQSGLLMRGAEGEGALFLINGVNVRLDSTVYLQAQPAQGEMIVNTLEGTTIIEAYGVTQTSLAGTSVRILIGSDLLAMAAPEVPQPFDPAVVPDLLLQILERHVEIVTPSGENTPVSQSSPTGEPTPPTGSISAFLDVGRSLWTQAIPSLLPEIGRLTRPLIQELMFRFTPVIPTASLTSQGSFGPAPTVQFIPTSAVFPTFTNLPLATAVQSTQPPVSPPPPSSTPEIIATTAPTDRPAPTAAPTNPPAPTSPPPTAAPTTPPAPTSPPPTAAPTNPPEPTGPPPTSAPTNPPPASEETSPVSP